MTVCTRRYRQTESVVRMDVRTMVRTSTGIVEASCFVALWERKR